MCITWYPVDAARGRCWWLHRLFFESCRSVSEALDKITHSVYDILAQCRRRTYFPASHRAHSTCDRHFHAQFVLTFSCDSHLNQYSWLISSLFFVVIMIVITVGILFLTFHRIDGDNIVNLNSVPIMSSWILRFAERCSSPLYGREPMHRWNEFSRCQGRVASALSRPMVYIRNLQQQSPTV